jgi:hypothetical protein
VCCTFGDHLRGQDDLQQTTAPPGLNVDVPDKKAGEMTVTPSIVSAWTGANTLSIAIDGLDIMSMEPGTEHTSHLRAAG